jgi:hypothetical protein
MPNNNQGVPLNDNQKQTAQELQLVKEIIVKPGDAASASAAAGASAAVVVANNSSSP